MAVTSVGWVHAADKVVDPAIFTDLGEAVVGKPIVFNVGTAKGTSTATNVRVKISLTGDNNPATLKDMGLMYFENGKWNVWNAESDEYWFGPTSGFPIKDLVSPILMKPTAKGEYNCKLEVVQNNNNNVLADTTFTVDVKETSSDLMIKSDTLYSTPNAYALSHGGYCADLLMETNASIVNGKGIYSTLVYAGGLPVTVSAAGDKTQIKLTAAPDSEAMILDPKQSGISLFGGMKEASVENTLITMTGGTINNLVGGGRGTNGKAAPHIYADVNGSTTINIEGGNVGYLIPGGYECAKSGDITVTITGANTRIGNALCGGYAPVGMDGQNINTVFNKSANRVNSTKLNMTGGTIYGYMFVGGGFSYSYSKEVEATFDGVTMNKGILGTGSNGRSDIVNITAKSCTFEKAVGQADVIEIAPLNRGIVENATMTFDGCTFPANTNDYFCYLGATYKYDGHSTVKLGNVTMSFKGKTTNIPVVGLSSGLEKANVTLNGAKASVAPFASSNIATVNAFTIGEDNTWNFNGGLTFENKATLTKTGTLNIKGIDNVADLQSAVAVGANSIGLIAKTFELPSHLLISKPMVIEGTITAKDSTIIKQADNWSGSDGTNKNLIRIDASNTTLKNLLVEGRKNLLVEGSKETGSGIHVYNAKDVTLDNVISRNNTAAGLIVNGSTVTATNFRTSGNGWYGVNVDKGEGVNGTPVFTIGSGCSFAEKDAIYADLKNATTDDASKYVVSNEWIMTKVTNKEHEYRWINAAAGGIDYAIISIPSTVVYGSANLPLISNVDDTKKVSFSVPENEFVSIKAKAGEAKYDSLEIKKPGSVAIKMTIGDTIVSQQLDVLKRVITVSGIKAQKKTYDGTTDVTLNTDDVEVKDFLGKGNAFSLYSGTLSSANVGDAVPVIIKATFTNSDDTNYYDVSYAAVTDTVTKAELTITTNKPTSINYGNSIPTFTANESGFVNNETNNVLGGKLQFDCPATSTSLAGKYPVKPYGYTSDNYNIKYEADSLEIKAIAPTVELVSATVSSDKSKVTAKGRIISNGGTPTTDLKGGFMVGSSDKATGLEVKPDGTFSTDLSELGNHEIEIKATAAAGDLKGTSTGTSVDLSQNLQNVNFVSELSRLTYGSTAQLSAKDFAEGAKVTFAIESNDASIEKVDSTTIKAVKVGTATITVTAEKEGCITAIAKQTVTVEPKNLTVTAKAVSKTYDGKLSADLPEFTLNGIVNGDNVTVNKNSVSASFIDKNVGENKPVVLSGDLTLAGTAASNYVLTQPTGLIGSIKQGADVKAIVSDVKRKYNEKTLKYNLKFMAGDTDLTSSPYTGTVQVDEEDGQFKVLIKDVSFPNYGKVTAQPEEGAITIEKGTPKVLTYNIDENNVGAKLLDAEGWNIQKGDITIKEDGDKSYAQVSYNNGTQTARGAALAKQKAPNIQWKFSALKALRSTLVTKTDSEDTMKFGESKTLTKESGYTYAVVNTKVLTLTTNGDNYIVNAVGVGTGAITATDEKGAVAYFSIEVTPKELTVLASGTDKTFDNTTSANVSLAIENMPEGVSLDLDGVTFNYESTNVESGITINPSKPITLSGANAANYELPKAKSFKGNITARELTITSPISKYYDGSATMTLSDYSAEGLIEGEAVPTVIATFTEDNNVGVNKKVKLTTTDTNYELVGHSDLKGNIVKSTLDATLPTEASDKDKLKDYVKLVVRETGASVTPGAVSYKPTVSTEGSGDNTVFYVSGGDNDNYSVVYDKNQIGYKANTTPPDGGGDVEQTVTIALNASSKVLPRTEEFELTATVSPAGKTVTWSSSDPTIATVTANGNKATVKGIKVGKATITAKIGDVTATCLVTVDFATGIEEMLAQTEVYSQPGNIIVNPVQPLQLTLVNMTGQTVYNDYISGSTQIPARSGVYIVKLSNAGNTIISKLIVR